MELRRYFRKPDVITNKDIHQNITLMVELKDENRNLCTDENGDIEWTDTTGNRFQKVAVKGGRVTVEFRLHKDKKSTHECQLNYKSLEFKFNVKRSTGDHTQHLSQ
jgi:hypothetical protein